MKASELYEWLGENTNPEQEILIEVGGDGAIHTGSIVSIRQRNGVKGPVILSSEED